VELCEANSSVLLMKSEGPCNTGRSVDHKEHENCHTPFVSSRPSRRRPRQTQLLLRCRMARRLRRSAQSGRKDPVVPEWTAKTMSKRTSTGNHTRSRGRKPQGVRAIPSAPRASASQRRAHEPTSRPLRSTRCWRAHLLEGSGARRNSNQREARWTPIPERR
jgi:hypothetical protein